MLDRNKIQINCIGCGLCAGIDQSVVFSMSEDGYYRPQFPTGYNFNSLEKICPVHYSVSESIDELWGHYLGVYRAYANNQEINLRASSGGVISAILIWMLESGTIDAVIQVGVNENDPLKNVVHISKSKEEILKCSGSRYAPASPLVSIKKCLEENQKYAFVGKPCDCRALKKFLSINKEYANKIVLIISFFCAGTPSEKATKQLIKVLGADEKTVKSVSYRGNGWPGYATVSDENGVYEMEYEKSWGGILGRTKQQFCRICADGTGESADISCGDAWKLGSDGSPDFSDSEGRNIVFVRSVIGQRVFLQCVNEDVINMEAYNIDELKYIQPYQYERKTTLISQIVALKICRKYTPDYSIGELIKLSRYVSLKKKIKIFLGTLKRIKNGNIK